MAVSKTAKKQAVPPKQVRRGRSRRRAASISSEESADGDVEEDSEGSEDGSEEDNQTDAEKPVSHAPARALSGHETGLLLSVDYDAKLPALLDDEVSLFDNMNSDDDNDDAIYQKVEEISDYDDDEDERQDEDELAAVWEAEAEQDPNFILDQLDENSVYGFRAEVDSGEEFVAFNSESDDIPNIQIKRRVHFSTDDMFPRLASEALSPVLTRTLLPSALPPLDISAVQSRASASASANTAKADAEPEEEDPYDSDATADNLPPEAHTTTPTAPFQKFDEVVATATPSPSMGRKKDRKKAKTPRPKGPPSGTFIVDQDKPWGILDASGKRVVMLPAPDSQRHDWLDARLKRDYDAPSNATFGQLLDESDGSVTSSQEIMESALEGTADIVSARLNCNQNNVGLVREATDPSQSFCPPIGYQVAGDYLISQEELNQTFSDSDEGDIPVDIRNFISFDDEPTDEEDSPTSPVVVINMPPVSELPGFAVDDEFPHLNNRKVTAFRRSADPAQAVLNNSPTFSNLLPSGPSTPRPQITRTSHKRKASNLPYQSSVYQGVTPVQRHVWHPKKRIRTTPRDNEST